MKQQQNIIFDNKVAEIELVYRCKVKVSNRIKITSGEEAATIFRKYWNKNTLQLQEEMKVMYLNHSNHLLAMYTVSKGGMTATVVDIRLILIAALRLGASHCLLCHSHPSGNLTASSADKMLTEKLKQGAALMDIKLLDHIILTAENHFSFAEHGMI